MMTDSEDIPTFQGTQREYVQKMVKCLQDAGFNVQINANGDGWSDPTLPSSQNDAMNAAGDQCIREIGEIQTKNFTDQQLAGFYGGLKKQYECLQENGFPTDPAPSLQAYQDHAHQTGIPDWNVMSALPRSQIPAALTACPNPVQG